MKAIETVKRFVKDEIGLETIEYAIISGLIVAGTIVTIAVIAAWINTRFNTLNNELGNG